MAGRHRKPTDTGRTVARIGVLTAMAAAPLGIVGTASASASAPSVEKTSTWDELAQCESTGPKAAVHLRTGVGDDLNRAATDAPLVAHVGGRCVRGDPALSHDSMKAHGVRVFERLALSIERVKSDHRCLERVHSSMG